MSKQIKSRKRVTDFGEVYTARRQVLDVLNLIPSECVNTTFFEPACGNGSFITEILRRKIMRINIKDPKVFSLQLLRCVASIYGVDIQRDIVLETIDGIVEISKNEYISVFHCLPDKTILETVRNISSRK